MSSANQEVIQLETILIVEKDAAVAQLEKKQLQRAGFPVIVAATADQALTQLGRNDIGLILVEYQLDEDVNGLTFVERVKAKGIDTPIILITGQSNEMLAIQAFRSGIRDLITKSEKYLDYLSEAVERVLKQVRTERRLVESEAGLAGIIESAKDAIIIAESDHRISLFNPAAEKMFRCPARLALGQLVSHFIPHERQINREKFGKGHDPVDESITRLIKYGNLGVRSDGTEFPLEASMSRAKAGKRKFYTIIIRDITERKQAEQEIRQSADLLHAVADGTTDAVYVKDLKGRYLLFNPAAARFVGRPVEEVIGKDDSELFDAESAKRVIERDRRIIASGLPETEEEVLTAAGVTRTYLATKAPYREKDGKIIGLIGISCDITDRKRSENELRMRDRAIQAVSQGILITDPNLPDNPIVYASPGFQRLTGYSASEVVNRNCRFLNGPGTDPATIAVIRNAVKQEQECFVELLNYRKDGTTFLNALHINPVRDENGRLTHFVGVQSDVTQHRRLEEQFRQSQKMEAVGQLAGGVAHDFNNLLTIISGYSELLLSMLPKNDNMRNSVKAISEAGERAASLTRQLLAFSRQSVLEPKVLNLNDVVRETEKMLRRLIGEDILLTSMLDSKLWKVKVDPGQLGQVLINLAVNARDAMPKGGKLTLETRNVELDKTFTALHSDVQPGKYVMLRINDTGHGMTTEIQSRIFEPFYTTKEVGRGTGLGLAVVHGIVIQSGGYIDVHSELGVGTTFKLYLPVVEGQASTLNDNNPGKGMRGAETVMLVEDEEAVRGLAHLALKSHGYNVMTAGEGKEALGLFDKYNGQVDLLVTDVVMPRMDGCDLAKAMQQRIPGLKVLYTSGYTDDEIVRHGISQAEVMFLPKPYTPFTLLRKIRCVLDER